MLAMRRDNFSAVISQLMSKFCEAGGRGVKQRDQRDGTILSLVSHQLSMFVKQKPDSKKMNKCINKLGDDKNSV